ncbi:MAG: RdgB/HAM1 family non-canonical purine NTP pyrophosphatase [Actinobacteria bacterium]|nr:RdgB/HAM1 family non-canonical purine NTP pyrophosphatase [Actinomycetota bacterium]
MKIVIATKNKGKIKEIKSFLDDLPEIELLTFEDFENFPDIDEGSLDFIENATLKAKSISEFTNAITLADDSGLVVDALCGEPGVKSSRYAGENATDKENRQKLLDNLGSCNSLKDRTARFICKMILWDPGKGLLKTSSGVCEGCIGFTEKGSGGFGYDSIFIPVGYNSCSSKTMAELSEHEKNMISHRGKALKNLKYFLKEKYGRKT